jgi:hypothetical protein
MHNRSICSGKIVKIESSTWDFHEIKTFSFDTVKTLERFRDMGLEHVNLGAVLGNREQQLRVGGTLTYNPFSVDNTY